jgi:branched-chain amino acid transport system permease protein
VVVIATLGAALVIRSSVIRWKGTAPRRLPGFFGFRTVEILGARIPMQNLLILGGAAVALALVGLLMQRTSFGRQVRALATDRSTAQLMGISVNLLSMAAFALAAALAAVGAVLVAPTQQLTPTFGFGPMLFAFAAAIIGGFGRIGGIALAAVLLGVLQQWATGYIDPSYREIYPFVIMLAILAVRPKGLLPEDVGRRV